MTRLERTEPIGTFCLVLHTHLPWVAHHGAWPVGEEWLHQAWSSSYLPVLDLLHRLAERGQRRALTLGVTPVVHAQLDDPGMLRDQAVWLAGWQLRAEELARRGGPDSEAAAREFRAALAAQRRLSDHWSGGLSPLLAPLVEADVVELLGGPAAHPFQPLLDEAWVRFSLATGLDDAVLRTGRRPAGVWAPECGYRPGLEQVYADLGVRRFLVDGPTLLRAGHDTGHAVRVGGTDVVAFARDLDVTYRVWSPRRGYPGGRWYRDFHAVDPGSGLRLHRVTSTSLPAERKAAYDPERAERAALVDAEDFVEVVRRRLGQLADQRGGRPGLVVAAYDTELFGHWWHEGPLWLEHVLEALPRVGVRVTTLAGAVEAGHVEGRASLPAGSWGSGKDFHVWDGDAVSDLVDDDRELQERVRKVLTVPSAARDLARDQLVRSTLLALSSDWAFMVSKDSAAHYARERHARHHGEAHALADLIERDHRRGADDLAARLRGVDGPFAHLDARLLG